MVDLGILSTLIGVANGHGADKDDGDDMSQRYRNKLASDRLFGKLQSISRSSKDAISEFPTIISHTFADKHEIAIRIVKNIELYFAYFIMISSGMNPQLGTGRTVKDHIGMLSGESLEDFKLAFESELKNELGEEAFSNWDIQKGVALNFCTAENVENKEGIYFLSISEEKMNNMLNLYKSKIQPENDKVYGREDDEGAPLIHTSRDPRSSNEVQRKIQVEQFKKFMSSTQPTIVNLELYLAGKEAPIQIALGVKAVPHFAHEEDIESLFESVQRKKMFKHRWIQWRTGEIKFFRDLMLNYDRIIRDKKLYASLGTMPWYRKLEEKRSKGFINSILNLIPIIRNTITLKEQLPTATLLVCNDEFVSTKNDFNQLIKKPSKIFSIMDHLMLLSLVVYNPVTEMVYFYFNGYQDALVYKLDQLAQTSNAGGQKDATNDLVKIMSKMIVNY